MEDRRHSSIFQVFQTLFIAGSGVLWETGTYSEKGQKGRYCMGTIVRYEGNSVLYIDPPIPQKLSRVVHISFQLCKGTRVTCLRDQGNPISLCVPYGN